jgi:hypothetical protein
MRTLHYGRRVSKGAAAPEVLAQAYTAGDLPTLTGSTELSRFVIVSGQVMHANRQEVHIRTRLVRDLSAVRSTQSLGVGVNINIVSRVVDPTNRLSHLVLLSEV